MDDIIKDFHDLTEIPPFQQMISDKKYMDTEEYLDVLQSKGRGRGLYHR